MPDTFPALYTRYKNGEISVSEAARKLNTTADILYKRIKEYENALKHNKLPEPETDGYPDGFYDYYKMFKNGKISVKTISEKTGKTANSVYYYIKKFEKENPRLVIK